MIKTDYEGAWKELRNKYAGELYLVREQNKFKCKVFLESFMIDIEKKHTKKQKEYRAGYGEKPTTTRPKPKPRP